MYIVQCTYLLALNIVKFAFMPLYIKGLFVIRSNYRKYVEFDRIYILIDNLKNVLNLNLINSTKFLNKLCPLKFDLKMGLCLPGKGS